MASSAPLYSESWPHIAGYINQLGTDGIVESKRGELERYAKFGIANKDKYIALEKVTRVPYPVSVVVHRRESEATHKGEDECNFNTYLGNGQPLNRRTTIVPENRGPFCSSLPATLDQFIAGGVDAYAIDGLSAVMQQGDQWELGRAWGSWPIEKMLYYAEKLNGWGYYYHGIRSPYIWGMTTMQERGKYVSDGKFDASVWDTQPGCAAILWMLGHLDPTINFTRES